MTIRIPSGSQRKWACTDRAEGYLELHASLSGEGPGTGGFFLKGEKRLCDFFFPDENGTDAWRCNADMTEVRPEGCSIRFDSPGGFSFNLSLLEGKGALSFSTFRESGRVQPIGLLLSCPLAKWSMSREGGITVWFDETGTAISSKMEFTLTSGIEAGGERRLLLECEGQTEPYYLVFGESIEAAVLSASLLARSDACERHRERIASFIESVSLFTGDTGYDDAVKWARFSLWMCIYHGASGETHFRSGLPALADFWVRDALVSIGGLLASGALFSEIRSLLCSIAARQDRDPMSPTAGRIPTRYALSGSVSYESADCSLLFVRALWEYAQVSGDLTALDDFSPVVFSALDAELKRCDSFGFLRHGDADTWMNARLPSGEAWTPRGDRACEIEAYWYTSLRLGVRLARRAGDSLREETYDCASRAVIQSFQSLFWCSQRNALADRLPPGPRGDWARDFSVRPNQLFAITAGLPLSPEEALLDNRARTGILENVERELLSPFGLFTLSPDDPLFHPQSETNDLHTKGAAYHNGTIWPWISGVYVTARASMPSARDEPVLPVYADALLRNQAKMLLDCECAGAIGETIEAGEEEHPRVSGPACQAWNHAEFTRNIFTDVTGFHSRLAEGTVEIRPFLPSRCDSWSATIPFGPGWTMDIDILKEGTSYIKCTLVWNTTKDTTASLAVNGESILPGKALTLWFGSETAPSSSFSHLLPRTLKSGRWITEPFARRDLFTHWCGSVWIPQYLENLIRSGKMYPATSGGPHAAALEWFFESDRFRRQYHTRTKMGALWARDSTLFRLWAPTARSVTLILYADGKDSPPHSFHPMASSASVPGEAGVWSVSVGGNLHGMYYRYRVQVHGIVRECADPWARSCGLDGKRSLVADYSRTDPPGWDDCVPPVTDSPNDAVVYELHVADASSSPSWKGSEEARRTYGGLVDEPSSAFDHIVSLGVTHVQLMPVFDFASVREADVRQNEYRNRVTGGVYNWGYDPYLWTCPEGSYSTNPADGLSRVRELKAVVQAFAKRGLGLIMDVVYNHAPSAQDNPLGICVPGYYFRTESFSGAGDDTASERFMFRAFMLDSLSWWLSAYKLCGFRFDLMGLHDVGTMNEIAGSLKMIKGDVILYGEGWDMYRGAKMVGASMKESRKLPDYGFFNDAFRSGVKGPVFHQYEGGFIHNGSRLESVKFGLVGTVYHGQVHNRLVEGTSNPNPWSDKTSSSVNYVEIHDNATLYDSNLLIEPGKTPEWYFRLQKMAIGLLLLAQGMPVLHAGIEFLRTKEIPPDILDDASIRLHDIYRSRDGSRAFSHNSYNLCDRINALDWDRASEMQNVVEWTRALVSIRRAHPLFRLRSAAAAESCIRFLDASNGTGVYPPLLAWELSSGDSGDAWNRALVIVNPAPVEQELSLPEPCAPMCWYRILDMGGLVGERKAEGKDCLVSAKALYLYAEF